MTGNAFHHEHSQLLTAVADNDWLGELIASSDPSVNGSQWLRVWARIEKCKPVKIRVLLKAANDPSDLRTLVLGEGSLNLASGAPQVEVAKFPDDPMLPTLPAAIAAAPGAEVVRYRPGRRCTIRTRMDQFVKVFPDDRAKRLHDEAAQLAECRAEGRLDFDVAAPAWFAPSMSAFAQVTLPGIGISDELFGPDGENLAWRVGAAAASIPDSGLRPTQTLEPTAELARTQRRASEVLAFVPDIAHEISRFLSELEAAHDRLEPATIRPIHGSPHPQQWLMDGKQLGLVDFDRFSLGDPELDVATFLGEIDFERGDHSGVANAFVAGYESRHGELDSRRLHVYRAHKRFAKVHRTAKSVKLNAPERVGAHLTKALAALSLVGVT